MNPDDLSEDDRAARDRLGQRDPLISEAPPAPGSARYQAILERSMSPNTVSPIKSRRTAWTFAAAGASAAAIAAFALVGNNAGATPTPGAAGPADVSSMLLVAAETTQEVTSMKVSAERVSKDGSNYTFTAEVDGTDYTLAQKSEDGDSARTVIGDQMWETDTTGSTHKATLSAEDHLTPFPEAAGNVVRAIAEDPNVKTVGTEKIDGLETTHYQLRIAAGTAEEDLPKVDRLPEQDLFWFDLEDEIGRSGDQSLDVWVADNLIRRVSFSVENADRAMDQAFVRTTDFSDFDADITIKAPTKK